jgi:hypothetical protein
MIVSNVPSDFSATPTWTSPTQKQVSGYFSRANYTLYSSSAGANITTYPYYKTGINTTLSTDDTLEIYWEDIVVTVLGHAPYTTSVMHMNHATQQYFWGIKTYVSSHALTFTRSDHSSMSEVETYIERNDIVADWNLTGNNDCVFYGSCDHFVITLVLVPSNSTYPTLMDAWDARTGITWLLSYEVNMNATSMSFWNILADLFSFKTLNLGIGGTAETMIGGCVAAFMIALVLIVIYKITTGLIPWISGGSGD